MPTTELENTLKLFFMGSSAFWPRVSWTSSVPKSPGLHLTAFHWFLFLLDVYFWYFIRSWWCFCSLECPCSLSSWNFLVNRSLHWKCQSWPSNNKSLIFLFFFFLHIVCLTLWQLLPFPVDCHLFPCRLSSHSDALSITVFPTVACDTVNDHWRC